MKFFYDAAKNAFFDSYENGRVAISSDEHSRLITESSAELMVITADENGIPVVRKISLSNKDLLEIKRKQHQSSGVVVNGVDMQTDGKSIAKMDQYATESMMNGLTVVHWQKADETFHDWAIVDFKMMFCEVTKYENNCFGRQSVLLDEINAAEDPETVDISVGWPSKTITFV